MKESHNPDTEQAPDTEDVKKALSAHVEAILSAWAENQPEALFQACIKLNAYYRKLFKDSMLGDIPEYLPNFNKYSKGYKNYVLPTSADLYGFTNHLFVGSNSDDENDARNGSALFSALIDGALENTPFQYHSDYRKLKAKVIMRKMSEDCVECEKDLSNIIWSEISRFPAKERDELTKTTQGNKQKTIDLVAKTVTEQPNRIYSESLTIAAQSYQATKKLHATLTSDEVNPIQKLENARVVYADPEVKKAFNSNSDSNVTRFFKTAGYYLAMFFSIGIIEAFKSSPIMSPQQRLGKRTYQAFEDVAYERLLHKRL